MPKGCRQKKTNSIFKDIVQIGGREVNPISNFMIFVKNSRGGREVNMINTLSKINLSKIGGEGGGSTSIWIMYTGFFFGRHPLAIFGQH